MGRNEDSQRGNFSLLPPAWTEWQWQVRRGSGRESERIGSVRYLHDALYSLALGPIAIFVLFNVTDSPD